MALNSSWRWGAWSLFLVLALLWSGGLGLLGAMLDWASHALASGDAARMGEAAAAWQMPPWLAPWVDEATLRALQESLKWVLDLGQSGLPWLGTALGWLTPLLWVLWFMGVMALFFLTLLGLRLLRSIPSTTASAR
ncbi:hypothetical protein [Roseateles sp.]|jgi:hypothetical protein|uniref:hypothetical protein n=1 Tax=Roseateles sp. TaxID=1971397 RepID=UPI00391D12FE